LRYKVRVKPGSRGSQGQDLAKTAAALEGGFIKTIAVSRRMRAYLLILYGTVTPKGTGRGVPRGDELTGKTIKIAVPPRAIWKGTWRQLLKESPPVFLKTYLRALGIPGIS
jgi:hypothetical protein